MYCIKCGEKLSNSAAFCSQCGKPTNDGVNDPADEWEYKTFSFVHKHWDYEFVMEEETLTILISDLDLIIQAEMIQHRKSGWEIDDPNYPNNLIANFQYEITEKRGLLGKQKYLSPRLINVRCRRRKAI